MSDTTDEYVELVALALRRTACDPFDAIGRLLTAAMVVGMKMEFERGTATADVPREAAETLARILVDNIPTGDLAADTAAQAVTTFRAAWGAA